MHTQNDAVSGESVAGTNRIPLHGFIAVYCPNEMRNGREKARVNEAARGKERQREAARGGEGITEM